MTLGQLEAQLKGRGFALLILILSVPFLVPNIPGLSTPFGFAILIIGLRLMVGRKPWLPQFVLNREISRPALHKTISLLLKVVLRMEKVAKPRWTPMLCWPGMGFLIGFGIAAQAFFLMLPLPIPFSNTLPAVSIILLAAGMMERDGLLILLGHAMGVFAYAYLALWLILGKAGIVWVLEFLLEWVRTGGPGPL